MAERPNNDAAGRVFEVLLRKVEQDHYPSNQHLDLLERAATDEQREKLIAVLADKIAQDRYPSLQMIRRMLRLAAAS